jgi:RHS repeat-associated protein
MAVAAALVLLVSIASPLTAQTAVAPEPYRNADAYGVDVTTGSFNHTVGEITGGGIDIVRYWTQAGWNDSWGGTLRDETSSGIRTVTIRQGGVSESFRYVSNAWVSQKANGGALTSTYIRAGNYHYDYRMADGTLIQYDTVGGEAVAPDDNRPAFIGVDGANGYCTTGNATPANANPICATPRSIVRPSGQRFDMSWNEQAACEPVSVEGLPTLSWSCTVTYRLERIDANNGHVADYRYDSSANDGPAWQRLMQVILIDRSVETCPEYLSDCGTMQSWPSVSYANPSAGVEVVTDEHGRSWRYTFASGRMTSIQRPGETAPSSVISYDSSNRVTSVVHNGETRTYTWTTVASNVNLVASDAMTGSTTVVSTPTAGQPASITDPLSNTTQFQYDGNNRVIRETRPEGDYTAYTRDARGNITQTRIVAKPGSGLADIVSSANYDASCTLVAKCNNPNWTIDPLGNRTDYTYDATHGQLLRVQLPAPTTGGIRPEINYSYTALYAQERDSNGALVNVATPQYLVTQVSSCSSAATCTGTANETRTTISYNDPNLLPTGVTTASGNGAITSTTSYAYDQRGNLTAVDGPLAGNADTTTFIVDSLDRRRGVIGPDPDGASSRLRVGERYSFDSASRIIKVERGTVTAATAAALDAMTALQTLDVVYDAAGNRVRETASAGGATITVVQHSFDARYRPICTALRMNPATWASLPADACTPATVGPDGPDRITRNSYDASDRVTLVETAVGTTAASNEVATSYTANGQVDHVTDAEGNRTSYVYDGHNRLSQTRLPVTTVGANASSTSDYEQLTYDAASRVIQRRLRDGQVIALTYDNLSRLTLRNLPGSAIDYTYAYDLAGRMVTATGSTGGTPLSFTYDALGRQLSSTATQGTIEYSYDAAGRRSRLDYTDSFFVTYDYDAIGNVTAIRENGATSGVGVLATYAYDSLGRRNSVTFGNGTVQTLTFDNADRLTTLANNLGGTAQDQSVSFTYNPAGQIGQQVRSNDAYAWTQHYNVDRAYGVNGLNQILTAGLTTLSYDARGNLTNSNGQSYTYTADNQMATAPNGVIFGWDALGRLLRYSSTANPTPVRFAYDGINAISEHSNLIVQRRYVHGPGTDDPIVWYEGSGTCQSGSTCDRRFLMADERGSIVSVTDSAGATLAINAYDEYGIPAPTNLGRFQYTGQMWLPEAGLYHYKARMYSPTLGRFMQTDPIGYADGMNWYAYVGGDPVNFRDPLGLCFIQIGRVIHRYYREGDPSGRTGCTLTPGELARNFGVGGGDIVVHGLGGNTGGLGSPTGFGRGGSGDGDSVGLTGRGRGGVGASAPAARRPVADDSCQRAAREAGEITATFFGATAIVGGGITGGWGAFENRRSGTTGTFRTLGGGGGFDIGVAGLQLEYINADALQGLGMGLNGSIGPFSGTINWSWGRLFPTGYGYGIGRGGARLGVSATMTGTRLTNCTYRN